MTIMTARKVNLEIVHLSDFTEAEREMICNALDNRVTWGDQDKCLVNFETVLGALDLEVMGADEYGPNPEENEKLVNKIEKSGFDKNTYLDLMA